MTSHASQRRGRGVRAAFGGLIGFLWLPVVALSQPREDAASAFFGLTRLHTIELSLTPEAWDAMEPERRVPAGFPGFPGPGGPRGGEGGGSQAGLDSGLAGPFRGPDFNRAFEQGQAARPGLASAMGIEFPYVRASVVVDGERWEEVGVRYKGNGTYMMSQGMDKRPLKLDFNRYVKGQKLRGLATLNLHNNVVDATYLHEALGYEVSRAFGVPAPRTAYARVYVTVPGRFERTYLGLYTVVEQVNKDFLERWYGTRKGLLIKPGSRDSFRDLGEAWAPYARSLNAQTEGSPAEQAQVMRFVRWVVSEEDTNRGRELGEVTDLDSLARFLALNVGLSNLDSFLTLGQNYYAYVEPVTGRMHWWLWDLDNAWGYFALMGTAESRVDLSIAQPHPEDQHLVRRLLAVPAVQERYRAELRRLVEGPMHPDTLKPRIEEAVAFLEPLLAEEGSGTAVRFRQAVLGSEAASTPTVATVAAAAGRGPMMIGGDNLPLLTFIHRRVASVRSQLDGRSSGTPLASGFGFPGGPGRPQAGGEGGRGLGGPGRPPGGGPGGFRGPGGPGGPPGPGFFMALPFLMAGDEDQNGSLTREEFQALAGTWHEAWGGTEEKGLDAEALAAGWRTIFRPPGGAGSMGGFGGKPQVLRPAVPLMFPGPAMPDVSAGLAPVFMGAADTDRDGRVSREEMEKQFTGWHEAWDGEGTGLVDAEGLGAGLQKVLPTGQGMGRPGPGPEAAHFPLGQRETPPAPRL